MSWKMLFKTFLYSQTILEAFKEILKRWQNPKIKWQEWMISQKNLISIKINVMCVFNSPSLLITSTLFSSRLFLTSFVWLPPVHCFEISRLTSKATTHIYIYTHNTDKKVKGKKRPQREYINNAERKFKKL